VYRRTDYKYLFASEGCLTLTGYTADELTNGTINFFDIVHPDDVQQVKDIIKKTIDVGLPFEGSHRIITKDGSIKWIRYKK